MLPSGIQSLRLESAADFHELSDILSKRSSRTGYEKMYVLDIASMSWDILRLWRCRAWGFYQSVDIESRYHRRDWIVVRGKAQVTLNDDNRTIHANESIYVPIGSTHRLAIRERFRWN